MADLASITDLEARLGRELTAAEETRATAYLADASALVRRYARQTFTTVANDLVIVRPTGSFLVLAQLPVTAVNEVRAVDSDGTVGAIVTGWSFDGIDRIDIANIGFIAGDPWWPWPYGPDAFQVDNDHGDDAVPDDVVAVVCGMVLRVLLSPSQIEGLNTERIGQYSYGFQQGGGGTPGVAVRLSEQDKEALSSYRPKAGSVQVRI